MSEYQHAAARASHRSKVACICKTQLTHCSALFPCSLVHVLLEYEEELGQELLGFADRLPAASRKICLEEGRQALMFMSLVVIPLLDTNSDNVVDLAELLGLQVS